LRAALEEARRKSEQGSQERQGEVLEIDIETELARRFLQDAIVSVAKGVRGADLVHEVRDEVRGSRVLAKMLIHSSPRRRPGPMVQPHCTARSGGGMGPGLRREDMRFAGLRNLLAILSHSLARSSGASRTQGASSRPGSTS
jgi:hypothetical protein